jgi:radical SAM protein with 4Fe4S-binding SPASM domain
MENYYTLSNNVYLVQGLARAAIYDLNLGDLYSIDSAAADFIKSFEKKGIDLSCLSDFEIGIFDSLLHNKLIIQTDKLIPIKPIESLKKEYPIDFAWIEVTRKCNLSCTFCYEGSNPYCSERMSVDQFKLVMNNLIDVGIKKIQFIGGEPTILKEDLKTMIKLAREHFDFIEVYSNGVLINEDWCKFFKEHDIHVALSIHSYDANQHDQVTCVKGSHAKVEKALEIIKRFGVNYRIGTVTSKTCKLGTPQKDTKYRLNPKLPKVTGMADLEGYDLEMFKIKAITKNTKRHKLSKNVVQKAISGHQCFIKDLYINSLLEVFPCVMERRISHGSLKEKSLKEIINNDIRHLSKDHIEGCKNCEYRYGCFDCRPDSNGNDLYSKPWYCSYDPTNGEWHNLEDLFSYLKGKNKLNAIPIIVEN